jgi:hypothetical protein
VFANAASLTPHSIFLDSVRERIDIEQTSHIVDLISAYLNEEFAPPLEARE